MKDAFIIGHKIEIKLNLHCNRQSWSSLSWLAFEFVLRVPLGFFPNDLLVFSENEVRALFRNDKTDKFITVDIISEKDTDNENIKDYEFSAPSLKKGYYKLLVVQMESHYLIEQQYFITGKLRK